MPSELAHAGDGDEPGLSARRRPAHCAARRCPATRRPRARRPWPSCGARHADAGERGRLRGRGRTLRPRLPARAREANDHYAACYVPASVARWLAAEPELVAAATHFLVERDPLDAAAWAGHGTRRTRSSLPRPVHAAALRSADRGAFHGARGVGPCAGRTGSRERQAWDVGTRLPPAWSYCAPRRTSTIGIAAPRMARRSGADGDVWPATAFAMLRRAQSSAHASAANVFDSIDSIAQDSDDWLR